MHVIEGEGVRINDNIIIGEIGIWFRIQILIRKVDFYRLKNSLR